METIEVRSKSYVIKWVDALENSTLFYEIKPIKKSISVGIYTYKEGEAPFQQDIRNSNVLSLNDNQAPRLSESRRRSATVGSTSSGNLSLEQKLDNAHLVKHDDLGRLNGEELIKGEINVTKANVYAFVFDNTFSKTTGKKVLFTQYSDQEKKENNIGNYRIPSSAHSEQPSPSLGATSSSVPVYQNKRASSSSSSLSFRKKSIEHTTSIKFDLPEVEDEAVQRVKGGRYLQGFLLKKRRKKTGKNFNKRFFTLNFKYGILNYYLNDKSKHVRGNMFIKFVGITADVKSRIIVLDSGLEIWTLKASSDEDLQTWVNAFNVIKQQGTSENEEEHNHSFRTIEEREADDDSINEDWTQELIKDLEVLHIKIESLKLKSSTLSRTIESGNLSNGDRSASVSTQSSSSLQSTASVSRKPSFWRKRSPSVAADLPQTKDLKTAPFTPAKISKELNDELSEADNMIKQLISKQQFRARSIHANPLSRGSTITTAANSIFSQEFFDANEYVNELNSGVLMIKHNDSEFLASREDLQAPYKTSSTPATHEEEESIPDTDEDDNESSSSSGDDMDETHIEDPGTPLTDVETDLYPLTEIKKSIVRRNDILPSTGAPPSILSFVRKNIGKDLSTISMPVTSNEPLTMLQKYSEIFEYCHLLHQASDADLASGERILKIAVFATTYLSSLRSKERNNRKPFNPLLGETYELVREDLGLRLISEKVSHRPQIFAMHADSESWALQYSPSPAQKFWSKNAEVINKGTVKLTYKKTGEMYQWSQPTCLLKNIIAGEKYTEPSSSIIVSSSTGQKAVVEFKQGGMFSGRSEDLTITAYDGSSKRLPSSVTGTWTAALTLKDAKNGEETIWECGKLVANSNKKYGFTEFAASLNEMTSVEQGLVSPTDSRLRPDLLCYEKGDVEEAETLKLKLEQDQRDRRTNGVAFEPAFFNRIDDERYELKKGAENYWERRRRNDWNGLLELW